MIYFACDYHEGAHENIMRRMIETNLEQTAGYSEDQHCQAAREKILKACGDPEGSTYAVHFLVGGTQTNMTVIDAALRPHQGVLCADTGHIHVHETGAVESCGHKALALPAADGKITATQIKKAVEEHFASDSFEHTVQPAMVYLSQSTELGTIYTKAELEQISQVCRGKGLLLFIDGARLAYALMAEDCDVTLQDMAELSDVFYIGGTKVGALFGEAVVIRNEALKKDFRYMIKQKGGMLAKGRLLGIQFEELFEDDLYWKLGAHADRMADQIRRAIEEKGYPYLVANKTNQIFVILPDALLEKMADRFVFSYDHRVDDKNSAVRICTSWATTQEQVDQLLDVMMNRKNKKED